jgi:hypothetical protein
MDKKRRRVMWQERGKERGKEEVKGEIISTNPRCRCGSYMVFPRIKNGRAGHFCHDCKRFRYDRPRWFERIMFWKY